MWGTLGLSFAAAGLAFAPMPSLCAPAVAVEAKVRSDVRASNAEVRFKHSKFEILQC